MKIVAFTNKAMDDRRNVRCYTDMWCHYLTGALLGSGVEIQYEPLLERESEFKQIEQCIRLDADGCDHVLAFGLRYFSKVSEDCVNVLRTKVPGAIAQIHDGPAPSRADVTFTVRDGAGVRGCCQVGWAADSLLFAPNHDGVLTFMVDHQSYDEGDDLRAQAIYDMVRAYVLGGSWRRFGWLSARVMTIADGGVREMDLEREYKLPPFSRGHIAIDDVAKEYGKAHVFFVTHPESVGLMCLEMAMCGAVTVTPENFIPYDLLQTIQHVSYRGVIPWDVVMASIDVRAVRARAVLNSWDAVAQKVIKYFLEFKR
jgi:hypothetical protein